MVTPESATRRAAQTTNKQTKKESYRRIGVVIGSGAL